MIRVHIICEGQTEENFVHELLVEPFISKNIHLIPSLIGTPGHKGGNINFDRLMTDIRHRLLGDKTAFCTTFIDFYGLPSNFPGKKEAVVCVNLDEKFSYICNSVNKKVENIIGDHARRFIPYVQMHEFEALLFSNPKEFAIGIGRKDIEVKLQKIRNSFTTPEEINDNSSTAPSKRIKNIMKDYEKPLHGILAALEIGLDFIRQECRHFNNWLNQLESLNLSK
ncbi:hypothetical protein MHK_002142 [Candidatus Magnetomorum sp. HK-1]|nr:hypothetical protein MHK_002142 [Candidatus Magnetomorum sp. HK-1]